MWHDGDIGPTQPSGHFRDLLQPLSRVRYLIWRLFGGRGPIELALNSGLRIKIRSLSTTDYGVAWDIYWRGCYQCPEPLPQVRRIVDLGANVGYSCLFWCQRFPDATVTAFEPHPEHLKAIAGHLSANRLADRVTVIAAAAGVSEGSGYLADAGSSSAITGTPDGYPIRVVDLFKTVKGPIDLLKIDIEGSEYGLLADERFPDFGARTVVVEWHKTADRPDGKKWSEDRLHDCGYRTVAGFEDLPHAGLIWGFR